jgi:Flp pilus assembly protein TadG
MRRFTQWSLLQRDRRGSVAVEFGLLGPLFIAMLIGILQVSVAMQAYNAMRNVSADVSRQAMVQYQTGNRLTRAQLSAMTASTAIRAPYLLNGDNLVVRVSDAAAQRVAGAHEFTLEVDYVVPTILPFMGWAAPTMTYSRPMFVIN